MEDTIRRLIEYMGDDPDRDGLKDTPSRVVKAMKYLTRGYDQTVETVVNGALFQSETNEMIVVQDIEMFSMCEHHLLPFVGKCHVAYIPSNLVIGLSKVARIVDMYAQRLQIQETLTKQIADAILEITNASGVAVIIEAKHMCMMMRGVQKQNSIMKTSVMLGAFRSNVSTRMEFMQLLNRQSS